MMLCSVREIVMFRVSQFAIVMAAWILTSVGVASADPYFTGHRYERGHYYAPLHAVPPHPPINVAPVAPVYGVPVPYDRVYLVPEPNPIPQFGWVYVRPANCGEYRYWDGTDCIDARDYPPAIGR